MAAAPWMQRFHAENADRLNTYPQPTAANEYSRRQCELRKIEVEPVQQAISSIFSASSETKLRTMQPSNLD